MTDYNPLPRSRKLKWLLTNGRIVEEPDLEQSSEGRRVRARGTTKSVYAKDLDDLIYRSVSQVATSLGETVWMRVVDDDPIQELYSVEGGSKPVTQPHFVESGDSHYGRETELVWDFRHETLPIAARITVQLEETASYLRRSNPRQPSQNLRVRVSYPSTNSLDAYDRSWMETHDGKEFPFTTHGGGDDFPQQRQNFLDWLRANQPEWASNILGSDSFVNEREAAAGIARKVRQIEELEEITIPDLRDPSEPTWLTLKLHSTSYTRAFTQSLVDFLNGQPIVEQVKTHWEQIVDLLRRVGIVTSALEDSHLHALLKGELGRADVSIDSVAAPNDEGGRDTHHSIGFDLATGTVTVTCSHRDTRLEDVTTEYEIARMRAEARGELDTFLGYHADFMNINHNKRHDRTVSDRSATVDTDDLDELLAGQ